MRATLFRVMMVLGQSCQPPFGFLPQSPPVIQMPVRFPKILAPRRIPRSIGPGFPNALKIATDIQGSRGSIFVGIADISHVQPRHGVIVGPASSLVSCGGTVVWARTINVIGHETHENIFAVPMGMRVSNEGMVLHTRAVGVRLKLGTDVSLQQHDFGQDDFDARFGIDGIVPVRDESGPPQMMQGPSKPSHNPVGIGGKFEQYGFQGIGGHNHVVVHHQDPVVGGRRSRQLKPQAQSVVLVFHRGIEVAHFGVMVFKGRGRIGMQQ